MQELERGWRRIVSELGIDFGTSEPHEPTIACSRRRARRSRASSSSSTPTGSSSRSRRRRASSTCRRATRSDTSTIGGNHMVFCAVYGCPFVREGLERRDATYADFENLVRLVAVVPAARLAGRHDLRAERQAARLAPPRHGLRAADALATSRSWARSPPARTRRTRSRWRRWCSAESRSSETPAIISLINVNSPLRYDDRMLDALHRLREARTRRVVITPFLLMGAMSPVSVPATLAQQVGEALAGIALVQTIRPGCPVVFGSFLSNTDMQSGSPSFGTPESAVGLLCTGQIARHYGLPFRGGGALTSSQAVDAQAGVRVDDVALADVPRRHELRHALGGLARVGRSSPATRSSSSTSRCCACCTRCSSR